MFMHLEIPGKNVFVSVFWSSGLWEKKNHTHLFFWYGEKVTSHRILPNASSSSEVAFPKKKKKEELLGQLQELLRPLGIKSHCNVGKGTDAIQLTHDSKTPAYGTISAPKAALHVEISPRFKISNTNISVCFDYWLLLLPAPFHEVMQLTQARANCVRSRSEGKKIWKKLDDFKAMVKMNVERGVFMNGLWNCTCSACPLEPS